MRINEKNLAVFELDQDMIKICACITTTDGHKLPWVKEIRYLGVYITQSRKFSDAPLTMPNNHFTDLLMAFLGNW